MNQDLPATIGADGNTKWGFHFSMIESQAAQLSSHLMYASGERRTFVADHLRPSRNRDPSSSSARVPNTLQSPTTCAALRFLEDTVHIWHKFHEGALPGIQLPVGTFAPLGLGDF